LNDALRLRSGLHDLGNAPGVTLNACVTSPATASVWSCAAADACHRAAESGPVVNERPIIAAAAAARTDLFGIDDRFRR
jgi:hypothetical protein